MIMKMTGQALALLIVSAALLMTGCEADNCSATCCNGDVVTDHHEEQSSCTFFTGLECDSHGGGPSVITYEGSLVWEKGEATCPTMHACVGSCTDGAEVTGEYYSRDMCVFFATIDCNDDHKGTVSVEYNGQQVSP